MLNPVLRLKQFSPAERLIVVEATLSLALAFLAVAILPFSVATRLARPPLSDGATDGDRDQAVRAIRWAVPMCARHVPWRAKCLEQAFAAHWMLRRRAVAAVIHYGVARTSAGLAAHAWVQAGPIEVVGCESAGEFAEIAQFPALAG